MLTRREFGARAAGLLALLAGIPAAAVAAKKVWQPTLDATTRHSPGHWHAGGGNQLSQRAYRLRGPPPWPHPPRAVSSGDAAHASALF